ncbi:MAG: glutathione S-transferase family protein [Pseudomonadota bacterium]
MSDKVMLYTHPMSRGSIVRWMLEEIGQPYDTEILTYYGTMKEPAYLAINPMGKVPAIKHRDVVVTECGAIIAYLADAFPDAGLAPAVTDPKRGIYYRWLFFSAGCIDPAATNKSMGFVVPDDKLAMSGYGSVDNVVDALDGWFSKNDFVLGDTFSAADIYVGAQINWLTEFKVLEKRPSFEAYVARILARPSAARAKEIDDKIIAERPELIPPGMMPENA